MTDPETTAYPIRHEDGIGIGLTKRELFAAMAMQGLLSDAENSTRSLSIVADVGKASVNFADALIKALNETKE